MTANHIEYHKSVSLNLLVEVGSWTQEESEDINVDSMKANRHDLLWKEQTSVTECGRPPDPVIEQLETMFADCRHARSDSLQNGYPFLRRWSQALQDEAFAMLYDSRAANIRGSDVYRCFPRTSAGDESQSTSGGNRSTTKAVAGSAVSLK